MIRQPTTAAAAFAWWRQALEDVRFHLSVSANPTPECGYFETRLRRGGIMVPARIWLDADIDEDTGELMSDETFQCEVNGRFADAHAQWQWLCARPITKERFDYLEARRHYTAWHCPGDPAANPRQPVDWLAVPVPNFERTSA